MPPSLHRTTETATSGSQDGESACRAPAPGAASTRRARALAARPPGARRGRTASARGGWRRADRRRAARASRTSALARPRRVAASDADGAHQRSRARLPARDGAGLAAHARGRGRDREAHRGGAARAASSPCSATPFGVREVLAIAEELRKGKHRRCASVLDGLDEIEPTHTPEERRRTSCAKAAKVKRLEGEIVKKLASIANSRTSDDTRERLRGEIDELLRQVVDLMRETRFAKSRIEEIMSGCSRSRSELRRHARGGAQASWPRSRCGPTSSASSRRSPRAAASARRRRSTRLGGDPERVRRARRRARRDRARRSQKIEADTAHVARRDRDRRSRRSPTRRSARSARRASSSRPTCASSSRSRRSTRTAGCSSST